MKRLRVLFLLFVLLSVSLYSQHYSSEILKTVSYFEIKGNKLICTDSVFLQINNRLGDHDAQINLLYSKGDKVDIQYAQIEDIHGNIIRKLKKSEINDRSYISDISFYDDTYIKTFELKHNVYPYRINYAVKTTLSRFLFIPSLNLEYYRKPVRSGKMVLKVPQDYLIRYKQANIKDPLIEKSDGIISYNWEYEYLPFQYQQTHTDCNNLSIPQLKIVPLNFIYGEKGSWKSWQSFAAWVSRLNKNRDILPDDEKAVVDKLIQDAGDSREKAKVLYNYLQQTTRYVNVKLDIGGFQTYPAQYVSENRYGDCKALTNYMQSLLKHAGIKSYYTLVHASPKIKSIDPDFPFQDFNHVILTVLFENDTVFLECTSNNMPFGYVHSSIQGRKGLLVHDNTGYLISIPEMQVENVLCSRNLIIDNNHIKLKSVQQGAGYEEFGHLMRSINKNVVERYLRNTIFGQGNYHLIDYKFLDGEKEFPSITLDANLKMESVLKIYGSDLVIAPFPFKISSFETPEKRQCDIKIDFPIYLCDTITYHMPAKQIVGIPEKVEIKNQFGYYKHTITVEGNKLILLKSVLINRGHYHVDDYKEFYNFIIQVNQNENRNIKVEII